MGPESERRKLCLNFDHQSVLFYKDPVWLRCATRATKRILLAWSTKRNLFAKSFHGWVQLCATNLMTVINLRLATIMLQ